MYKDNKEARVEDFQKASHDLLALLFDVCEACIQVAPDENKRKALAFTAMAVRGAIHTFLTLIRKE